MISLSRVGPMAYRPSRSITKIGRRITHDTCYIAHQFQGQKVSITEGLTQTHKMRHIFRTVKPKNFKCAYGGRRPASAASAMTSKVKGQDHKVTWYVWPVWVILQNLHLVLWQTYKDAYYRQSRWSPKSKVTSSHHLYVSIYLPLLNSGNKMLYLCHRGGRGHTVSAESGGHTSCSYCNMTTNINVMNSLLLEYFFMSHVVHERSFTQIAWRVPINHKKFSCRRETARASCHWMVW